MKSTLSRISISLFLASISQSRLAADLQALDVAALPGDKVELKLTFDEPVAVPKGYTIEQPARIALDLPGVTNKLGAKNRELGVGNARSVTVVEAGERMVCARKEIIYLLLLVKVQLILHHCEPLQ